MSYGLPIKDIDLIHTSQAEIPISNYYTNTGFFPIEFTPMGSTAILFPDQKTGLYFGIQLDFEYINQIRKEIIPDEAQESRE